MQKVNITTTVSLTIFLDIDGNNHIPLRLSKEFEGDLPIKQEEVFQPGYYQGQAKVTRVCWSLDRTDGQQVKYIDAEMEEVYPGNTRTGITECLKDAGWRKFD